MNAARSVIAVLWLLAPDSRPESYLGVHTALPAFVEEDTMEAPDLAPGLQVTEVIENSPAEQAGFQVGDAVLRLGEEAPRTPQHLDALVAALPPGSRLRTTARRAGSIIELEPVTVARLMPGDAPPVKRFVEGRRFGLSFESLSTEESRTRGIRPGDGVRVRRLLEGGSAAGSDLRPGDIILALGAEPIHGGDDLLAAVRDLEPGSLVYFQTLRGDERRKVPVKVREPESHISRFHIPPLIVYYESDPRKEETTFGFLLNIFKYTRKEDRRTYRFLWLIKLETGTNEVLEEVEE